MIDTILSEWRLAHNRLRDDQLSRAEAVYAIQVGLPVLGALHELEGRLRSAAGPMMPAEVLSELRPIIGLAIGEGQRRAERMGRHLEIAGVPAIPRCALLEDILSADPP